MEPAEMDRPVVDIDPAWIMENTSGTTHLSMQEAIAHCDTLIEEARVRAHHPFQPGDLVMVKETSVHGEICSGFQGVTLFTVDESVKSNPLMLDYYTTARLGTVAVKLTAPVGVAGLPPDPTLFLPSQLERIERIDPENSRHVSFGPKAREEIERSIAEIRQRMYEGEQ